MTETPSGMMNAIGLQNPGIDVFIKRDLEFLKKYDTNIIVNVCGHSIDEYVDVVVRQLELMPQEVIIQRLTGDGGRESLVGPMWSLKKFEVLNAIDKMMAARSTWQGRLLTKTPE